MFDWVLNTILGTMDLETSSRAFFDPFFTSVFFYFSAS